MIFLIGNIENARNLQLKFLPLISALFCEVNPIPVKAALNILGYNFGTPRLPLTEMTEKNKKILIQEMKNLKLII